MILPVVEAETAFTSFICRLMNSEQVNKV